MAKIQSGSRSRWTDVGEVEVCQTGVSGTVRKDSQSAEFGDERPTDRLMQVGDRLSRAPVKLIPDACEDWASTKATCQSSNNDKQELLVIFDTIELVFPKHPSKESPGDIGTSITDLEGVKVTRRSGSIHRHIV